MLGNKMPDTQEKPKIDMIPLIYAGQMPDEVYDYCGEREISTHYQNDVVHLDDDGNVFSEWLKAIGIPMREDGDGWQVAIIAT
jgi:hypothetical protein